MIHCLSASPASVSFFVGQKGERLWPCINYWGLEQLRTVNIVSKLDLQSGYNLVHIRDEWKTSLQHLVISIG